MDAEQEIRQPELSYLSFTYTVFVVNFLSLVRSDEPFQTQLRRIDWARAGVYEYAVQETAKGIPNERRDDWDPEVVVSGGPHLGPIPDHVEHQPGPEISSKVHGVVGFEAKAGAETED